MASLVVRRKKTKEITRRQAQRVGGEYFSSLLMRYLDLPESTLVLPSHGKPFTGLATRITQLQDHHRERLEEILQAAGDHALSAADTLPILFKRKLDTHQISFAM